MDFEELTLFMPDTTCTACNAEFLDLDDLHVHVKQMHSSAVSSKTCQFCPETYTDMLNYAAHVRDTHLMDIRCCRFCTKSFLDGAKLNSHEKTHNRTDNVYSCSRCNKTFHKMLMLELHERKDHDDDVDGYILKCMPYLSFILNLNAVDFLQYSGKKVFVCSCHFTSGNLQAYIKHLKVKNCKGYVCDRCSGLYKTKKNLLKHIQNAKKCIDVNADICMDCNTEVPPQSMKIHKKNCNALKCVVCNRVFTTIDELSLHQTKEHPLDMNVIRCSFCSKEYIGQVPLNKHIARVHKPYFHMYKYKCADCDIIFKHPQKLFAHFYSKHKKVEPFNCKICNKKFRVRKSFTLHIKLDHKSVGFIEFDDQYHVFFAANKSDKPFIPECVVPQDMFNLVSDDCKSKRFSIQALVDSDATDASGVESDEEKKPVKRKQTPKQKKSKQTKTRAIEDSVQVYSSDEEPLVEVRKRVQKKKVNSKRQWTWKKNSLPKTLFTCGICQEKCYTYQNHQNHMSIHSKNHEIECVKCSKKFNSKDDLTIHINTEHASSKLTETLKNLLEKKKLEPPSDENTPEPLSKPYRFKISMKKVQMDKSETPATLTAVEEGLSVKNFLENFTPEEASMGKVKIGSVVSLTRGTHTNRNTPTIKLTKFKEEPPIFESVSLKMPERFKQNEHYVKTKVSIKLIEQPTYSDLMLPDFSEHNYSETLENEDDNQDNDIPEVAHEVSLVGTEEPPRQQAPRRIIIPLLPKGYSKIQVATMHTEAPFFKIIKVDADKLKGARKQKQKEEEIPPKCDVIDLPGGTKLVTANPLAHLLGNTPVEKIMDSTKNKYYKPVIKDFQFMLAQAMNKLQEGPPPRKRKSKAGKQTKTANDSESE